MKFKSNWSFLKSTVYLKPWQWDNIIFSQILQAEKQKKYKNVCRNKWNLYDTPQSDSKSTILKGQSFVLVFLRERDFFFNTVSVFWVNTDI